MVQTIQCGIDLASYLSNGGAIRASGGHQVGRKFPLLLAAVALKDPELLKLASDPTLFIEDLTTFFVQQSDVGRNVESGESAKYIQGDLGIAEWGISHAWDPSKDDRRWRDGIPYRFAQWPAMTGQVLAADLMGLKEVWGHPVIFKYTERFMSKESDRSRFEDQMWETHKLGLPSFPQGLKIKR